MTADFDVAALFTALDGQRDARGIRWAQVAREINMPSSHRRDVPLISASSLTGMPKRKVLNGNIVVAALQWLGRTPESFVPGHSAPYGPGTVLPALTPRILLRWSTPALHTAINDQRTARGLTWPEVATEVGGFTPKSLEGLALHHTVAFPHVMRVLAWLERPAADFLVPLRI